MEFLSFLQQAFHWFILLLFYSSVLSVGLLLKILMTFSSFHHAPTFARHICVILTGCVQSSTAQKATIISRGFKQFWSCTIKETQPVHYSSPNRTAEPPRPEEPPRRPETFKELFLKSRLAPDRCSRVTCVMLRPSFPNNGGCVGRRVWREAGTDGEGEEQRSERSSRELPHPHLHPSRNWPPSSSAECNWPWCEGAEGGGSVHDAFFCLIFYISFHQVAQ